MSIVRPNRVKRKLREGRLVFDARISILDPQLVEAAGAAGIDILWIDGEHSNLNWDSALACVLAAELHGMTPILRPTAVPGYREYQIQRALNIGFQGMMLTGVSTPEEVQSLLDVMLYPPLGKRGVGEGRVHERAGERIQQGPEVLQEMNAEIFTCIVVETVECVQRIDEICAMDAVDTAGLGHRDYALDAGLPDFSLRQPGMEAARQAINDALRRHGKPCYGAASTPEELRRAVQEGALLFSAGREIRAWEKSLRQFVKMAADAGLAGVTH